MLTYCFCYILNYHFSVIDTF